MVVSLPAKMLTTKIVGEGYFNYLRTFRQLPFNFL